MEKAEVKETKKIKVFVPYGSKSYANWIHNKEFVDSVKDADLVFLTGGEDCDPALYDEPTGKWTYYNTNRENIEYAAGKEAIALGVPIFGTCKGFQMSCILAGGKLIQNMSHPGGHFITTKEGKKLRVNSLHHQMVYPYNLPEEDYEVLATTPELLSDEHLGGREEEMLKEGQQEIETAFFPKIKALGAQYHKEMMSEEQNPELFAWTRDLFKEKLGLIIV